MKKTRRSNDQPSPVGGGRRLSRRLTAVPVVTLLAAAFALSAGGCESPKGPRAAPGVAPAPTYTGPAYLRGTLGSLVRLRPGTELPLLVNGYGIVVNLNGTGSTSAPPALRQAMVNQMRKYGLGSANMGTLNMTPERVLADPNTAVVRIDGLIPPGASPGTRFDVIVTAIDSQTTSLAGGTLWTSTLGMRGTEQAFKFLHEQATAYGPIYDNPYHDRPDSGDPGEFSGIQAMVVAGGKVTAPRDLELVLNQSSYSRSRAIADRINERLGRADDRTPLANPLTDQLIKISIPPRYQANPGELVDLMMHLHLQTGPGFEQDQARRLADVLRQQPDTAESVGLAWRALGRPIVELLREYYNDPVLTVRLTALQTGAWLDDERASQSLSELAKHEDPLIRAMAAKALVLLPRSIKGARALKELLDDEDVAVRIAAYESLWVINDPLIASGRVAVADEPGTGIKYIIDTVPSQKPLVYVTQVGVPRIAIFSPDLGFDAPLLARMWDNRLMLSMDPGQDYLDIFYQPPHRTDSESASSIKLKTVPDLKTLVYVLGHKPTVEQPNEGLGLTYSQAVDVVYQLCRKQQIKSPIEVRVSPLAQQIAEYDRANAPVTRPETDPDAIDNGGLSRADTNPQAVAGAIPGANPGGDPLARPDTANPQPPSTR